MARVLIFSDIHTDGRALENLMDTEADYYFCAGDLATWQQGLDEMAKIMKRRAYGPGSVYMLPGNHESENDIVEFCHRHGFINFHGATLEIGGVTNCRTGLFEPDALQYARRIHRSRASIAAGEVRGIETAGADLPRAAARYQARCQVGHGVGLPRREPGPVAGSSIEKYQPRDFFCGHIHEAEGVVEQMGGTRAQNVGKPGYLLTL